MLPLNLAFPGPQWLNAPIQIASVLLIWLLSRKQAFGPTPRTRAFWHASPAVFALLLVVLLPALPSPSHPGLTAPPVASSAALARARAYGTPVPRGNPASTPASGPVAAATPAAPTPPQETTVLPDGALLVSPYIGPIEGQAYERWFYSTALDRDMPYWIYLPPDYGLAGRRYPVLYMLHGNGGHREEWAVYGLFDVADVEIHNGSLPPFIIILPQGDQGFWANHTGDGPQWGDYIAYDLVGHVDASYRTLRVAQRARHRGTVHGCLGHVAPGLLPS